MVIWDLKVKKRPHSDKHFFFFEADEIVLKSKLEKNVNFTGFSADIKRR